MQNMFDSLINQQAGSSLTLHLNTNIQSISRGAMRNIASAVVGHRHYIAFLPGGAKLQHYVKWAAGQSQGSELPWMCHNKAYWLRYEKQALIALINLSLANITSTATKRVTWSWSRLFNGGANEMKEHLSQWQVKHCQGCLQTSCIHLQRMLFGNIQWNSAPRSKLCWN